MHIYMCICACACVCAMYAHMCEERKRYGIRTMFTTIFLEGFELHLRGATGQSAFQ